MSLKLSTTIIQSSYKERSTKQANTASYIDPKMGSIEPPPSTSPQNANLDYDVLIIGAGLSGIYSLHRMHKLGLRAKVLEAASGPGGTWYWNRYPGARL